MLRAIPLEGEADEVLGARFRMIVVRHVDIGQDIVCALCQLFPGTILHITTATKGALHRSILSPIETVWNMTTTAPDRERSVEDRSVEAHHIIEAEAGAIEAEIEITEGITIETTIAITEIMNLAAIAEEVITIRTGVDVIAINQAEGLVRSLVESQGARTDATAGVGERAGVMKEGRDGIVPVAVSIGVEVAHANVRHGGTERVAIPGLLNVVWDLE